MPRIPDNDDVLPANDDITPAMKASILELATIIGRDIAQRQMPHNDSRAPRPPPLGVNP